MTSPPIEIPDHLNMAEWFLDARVAEGLGDKTAVYCGDETRSYQELVAGSAQVAAVLRDLGVRIEERVMLLLLDTPDFITTYFGVMRAGAVAVPVNTWMQPKDYAYYLEYARPRAVVVDKSVWPSLAPVIADAPYTDFVLVVDRHGHGVPAGTLDFVALTEAAKTFEPSIGPSYSASNISLYGGGAW